jgi:hypothetical protein
MPQLPRSESPPDWLAHPEEYQAPEAPSAHQVSDPSTDFEDEDQVDQAIIEGLHTRGIDSARMMAVDAQLGFDSDQAARQAAADLVMAGYPAVKVTQVFWDSIPSLHVMAWTMTVTVNTEVTLDALRSMRLALGQYASTRGGKWLGGGSVGMPDTDQWANTEPGAIDEVALDQSDQQLIDYLFAYDSDMKQATEIATALRFHAEEVARTVAVALIGAGYPEVRVAPAKVGWTTVVVASVVPKVQAVRALRVNLTTFAQSRGGSWLGCAGIVATPQTTS